MQKVSGLFCYLRKPHDLIHSILESEGEWHRAELLFHLLRNELFIVGQLIWNSWEYEGIKWDTRVDDLLCRTRVLPTLVLWL
jgi:hypothetical protein